MRSSAWCSVGSKSLQSVTKLGQPCPSNRYLPVAIEILLSCILGGEVTGKAPLLPSTSFSLQDSGERAEALLNHKSFCPDDSNQAEISQQNWSIPSSKVLITDSSARELNTGKIEQMTKILQSLSWHSFHAGPS